MKEYYKRLFYSTFLKISYIVIACVIISWPSMKEYKAQGYNKYTVMLGEKEVGVTDSLSDIYNCYRQARLELANELSTDELLYMADYVKLSYKGEEVVFGTEDSTRDIVDNMKDIIRANKRNDLVSSYAVKVNDEIINLETAENVKDIFQAVIDRYSGGDGFEVVIEGDSKRELNALTISINKSYSESFDGKEEELLKTTGAEKALTVDFDSDEDENLSFDSFEYGVVDMSFSERIELVESYVPMEQITSYEDAKDYFTDTKEVQEVYKVEQGDTLSEISIKVNLPMDDIVAMNESLEDSNSLIVPGQELIITSPEPALSVLWSYQARINEVYDLPTEYIYNDSWYTNQTQTIQQPSAGAHDAVLLVSMNNTEDIGSQVLYEEVLAEPVAKVVEKGTIVPPTYIKPISGGRLSSTFGYRNSPTKGASSYHKGVDWATPTGTTVVASCGGTVAFAGWGSGYGNVIYINHPDGRQTRYGHLSKIYVTTGQTVSQGEKIAASGNTGVSTGPHLHFEILINGSQVNPLSYIN